MQVSVAGVLRGLGTQVWTVAALKRKVLLAWPPQILASLKLCHTIWPSSYLTTVLHARPQACQDPSFLLPHPASHADCLSYLHCQRGHA